MYTQGYAKKRAYAGLIINSSPNIDFMHNDNIMILSAFCLFAIS